MLWLALLTRDTNTPASERLGIKDEVIALDFDLAVSYRLFRLRAEERKELSKRIAYEVMRMWNGVEDEDDSILDSAEIHPLIKADRFADGQTQGW